MISEHIRRNTCYFFFFNQADSESAYWAIRILQIDEKNTRLVSSLESGICVCRQTQASWSNAFLCKIDYIPPARNIGPIEYNQHSFVPAPTDEQAEQIIEQLHKLISGHNKDTSTAKSKQSELETIALKLLRLWAENPYTPVARLFERLGNLHFSLQMEIRKFISNKSWAEFAEARIGRSDMLLMLPNPNAYTLLGIPAPKDNQGRGGLIHRHYSMWIKAFFQDKAHKAHIEWIVPNTNHPVDVAVEYDGHIEAYEICISISENLTTHVEIFEKNPAVKKLTVIAGTKTELTEIKKLIRNNLLLVRFEDRIKLDVIENYMGDNRK